MIQKAIFKDCKKLQGCRFAPYTGETVFIINEHDLITLYDEEIISDFYYIKRRLRIL